MKKLFILLFSLSFLTSCSNSKKIDEVNDNSNENLIKTESYQFSMVMAGDSLIHEGVYYDAKEGDSYNFDKMLTQIKPIVEKYDLAFVNQESLIGGKSIGLSTYPRFNSPEEIGGALINAGFNIFSLANNHTLDRGEIAILNTHKYWEDKDVITVGSSLSAEERNNIPIYEENGISYAILGYTTVTNGLTVPTGKDYLLNVYDSELVKADIQKIREQVDIVMVSMHYGSEYTHVPTLEQQQIVEYLASLNVDIVIGHHPHVVQPITYIDDTLVVYSLGNFLSGQVGINRQIGMLVSLDIKKEVTGDETKVWIENVRGDLTYTHYSNGYKNYKVYPFNELTDSILPNYKQHEEDYGNIIGEYDSSILVNTYQWG